MVNNSKNNFTFVEYFYIDISSSKSQSHSQYHYGPEVEEIEILSNDPENIERKSALDEVQEANISEKLTTDQFIRDLSTSPQDRAMISVPEYGGNSRTGYYETIDDLLQRDPVDTNAARSLTSSSIHDLATTKELTIQDHESLIQTAPEIETGLESKSRSASRNSILHHDLTQETGMDLEHKKPLIISEPVKHSRLSTIVSSTTPIATDDTYEKSSLLQTTTTTTAAIDSSGATEPPAATVLTRASSGSLSPLVPPPRLSPSPPPPPLPTDNNDSGRVAYFFSDYGNDGEGDEDSILIDQSNFVVPAVSDVIPDDNTSSNLTGQSQASLLLPHSEHVSQQQHEQQQQQLASVMPSTFFTKNNNENIQEEIEEIETKETVAAEKGIATATLILPSSSSISRRSIAGCNYRQHANAIY